MNNYEDLPGKIKQLTNFQINKAIQELSLKKLVDTRECTILLSNSENWDLHFASLLYDAAGLAELDGKIQEVNLLNILSSLVVYSYGANSSTPEKALPAAVAVNLIFIAAGIFDDIQDQDKPNSLVAKVGVGEALDVGLAILLLGQELLADAIKDTISATNAFSLINRLNRCLLVGIKGQLLDLQETSIPLNLRFDSPEFYLLKNGLKAATMFSYITELGAALGYKESQSESISLYSQFGFNLGMTVQLIADLGDFLTIRQSGKIGRDLTQQLPTLPTVFTYQALDSIANKELLMELWQKLPDNKEDFALLVNSTPAIAQTIALITQYSAQAENSLRLLDPKLEKLEHKLMINLLRGFVGTLKPYFLQAF